MTDKEKQYLIGLLEAEICSVDFLRGFGADTPDGIKKKAFIRGIIFKIEDL
jgi:hypothetical protein